MNIVLIGMPGAGKSTVGPMLAAKTKMDFIDTDTVIKYKTGKELGDIVGSLGYEEFFKIQEEAVLSIYPVNSVIATGGSVVKSEASMLHLKNDGVVIYLKHDFNEIENRLSPGRKLARASGRSLYDLYKERVPLYEKYADISIDCSNNEADAVVDEILIKIERILSANK